jgi:hypothetical protein
MALELKTITFNHDPGSATTSAMNIRRDKDFEVLVPEYDSAAPVPPSESCAAYGRAETSGHNVFIRVSLTISAPANITYEVRASGGGVLGALDPAQAVFAGGTSVVVDVSLPHRDFTRVGRHDMTWQWESRPLGSGAWQALATTSHRIYVVLAVPPTPWVQTPASKKNPWTSLLDTCCSIAAGSQDPESAFEKIVKDVHQNHSLRYDVFQGAPRYGFVTTGSSFLMTKWIDYVLGAAAPANPKFCPGTSEQYRHFLIVNCYDCAASCALMAKVLGVPADYYFHQPFGYLRYVEPIGRGKCNNPFYGCMGNNPAVGPDAARTHFGNHAYPKLNGSQNYDGCMREWLAPLTKLMLILLWLIILISTLGLLNVKSLLLRAGGWLIDLPQATYDARTIDTSQPFEASAASGGSPVAHVLDFSTT